MAMASDKINQVLEKLDLLEVPDMFNRARRLDDTFSSTLGKIALDQDESKKKEMMSKLVTDQLKMME